MLSGVTWEEKPTLCHLTLRFIIVNSLEEPWKQKWDDKTLLFVHIRMTSAKCSLAFRIFRLRYFLFPFLTSSSMSLVPSSLGSHIKTSNVKWIEMSFSLTSAERRTHKIMRVNIPDSKDKDLGPGSEWPHSISKCLFPCSYSRGVNQQTSQGYFGTTVVARSMS